MEHNGKNDSFFILMDECRGTAPLAGVWVMWT